MSEPCACFTSYVRWKLVCYSCVCHSLKAHLCILPLILDLLWSELFSNLSFFIGLLLSRAEPCLIVGFSPFSPFFALFVVLLPFLPYHSVIPIVVLFDPCLLGLFGLASYSSLNVVIGFILMLFWAFLTHYIACGLLCPISFFLTILGPFSNYAFPWAFTNSFGLSYPNYLILHP